MTSSISLFGNQGSESIAFIGSFINRYLLSTYYAPGQCSLLVHIILLHPHSSVRGVSVAQHFQMPLGWFYPG